MTSLGIKASRTKSIPPAATSSRYSAPTPIPYPISMKLHLFESADAHPSHPKPPTLGWDDLAPSIERHEVAGTHFTLLAPRRIESLARTISRCLPR